MEITKTTFQRYEQVKEKWREADNLGLLELDLTLFDDRVLKKRDGRGAWRQWAPEPGERLVGRGGVGSEREERCARSVAVALEKKYLSRRSSVRGTKAWLFVDANEHLPGVHVRKVCGLIEGKIRLALCSFDVIAVEFRGGQEVRLWDRASFQAYSGREIDRGTAVAVPRGK